MTQQRDVRPRRPLYHRMVPRAMDELHRAATPLELLFDLCFVAAVSILAEELHHGLSEGVIEHNAVRYVFVFFAIWWAWMNFTWFASAYDSDDGLYRVATFVQMAGVLILAAGVPRAFQHADFAIIVIGYVTMRIALVGQWLRAAHGDALRRRTALKYAAGICVAQAGWIVLLFCPESYFVPGFILLAALELIVPAFAERGAVTPWHPRHIAERYGLFTLIVIGESVISTTRAFQVALDEGESKDDLIGLALASLIIICASWWLYFDREMHDRLSSLRRAFLWGYGHFFIFAALAAAGAGFAVAIDFETHHSALTSVEAGYAIAIPVGIYVLGVYGLHVMEHESLRAGIVFLAAALLILLSPLLGLGIFAVAALMAALVAFDELVKPGGILAEE